MQQEHFVFELTFAILALVGLGAIGFLLSRINGVLGELKSTVEDTRRRVDPVIEEAQHLVQETRESVSTLLTRTQATVSMVTARTEEITEMAEDQANEIRALARDTVLAARNQVERLDDLLRRTTTRVDQTAALIQKEVLEPIHELHCILVGVRRGLQVLFAKRKRMPVDRVYQDEEMFI